MKKTIAVLAGGYSGEFEVSVQSAQTIADHLDKNLYRVFIVYITKAGWYYLNSQKEQFSIDKNDFSLPLGKELIHFDAAFIAIHGSPGEDGKLQGYLEMLEIPYVGCNVATSALTFDKSYCNKIVSALGLVKVAPSLALTRGQNYTYSDIAGKLGNTVFVKPAQSGSSLGVSKVEKADDFGPALLKAWEIDKNALAEQYIKGKELGCGVYKTGDEIQVLPVTEIQSTKTFFDYEAKYTPGIATEITPAPIGDLLTGEIQNVAKSLYLKLNCAGVVRFDFIFQEDSQALYFLEVNTIPGQSLGSIIPKQIRAAGKSLSEVYNALIGQAL